MPGGVDFHSAVREGIGWTPDAEYGPHPAYAIESEDIRSDVEAEGDSAEHAGAKPYATSGSGGGTKKPRPIILTTRDDEILQFLVRYRMATYKTLAKRFSTSVNALRQRITRLADAGLIHKVSPGAPAYAVWLPTAEGVRRSGLPLTVPSFAWSKFEHTLCVADFGADLERNGEFVITEAEFIHAITSDGRGYAGTNLVKLTHNGRSHRPDLLVAQPTGLTWRAIEVELTRKSPAELRRVIRTYQNSSFPITVVTYLCEERAVAVGVARAAVETSAQNLVHVRRLTRAW